MAKYIHENQSLYDITQQYPETIPVFVAKGMDQMADEEKRESFGKKISLKMALTLRVLDSAPFIEALETAIDRAKEAKEGNVNVEKEYDDTVSITGLLPCPVRLPLMEIFEKKVSAYQDAHNVGVNYELKAASMGLEWVEKNIQGIQTADELPDLFISAGFDLFFDKKLIGKFREEGAFEDLLPWKDENPMFDGLAMHDPKKNYSIIGIVPAVFLVNQEELNGRTAPNSWKDLLNPEWENSVSLPVGDFDLFNGILLNIYKNYGDEGVEKLGKSLLESLHPSQMVNQREKRQSPPAITIMPYFFTKMVNNGGPMTAVWPEDGAILSPIFMLAKKNKAKELKPIVDFFASKEVADVLAVQGLFPSLHPDVKNPVPENPKLMWLGWDYIAEHDISEVIAHCMELFDKSIGGDA